MTGTDFILLILGGGICMNAYLVKINVVVFPSFSPFSHTSMIVSYSLAVKQYDDRMLMKMRTKIELGHTVAFEYIATRLDRCMAGKTVVFQASLLRPLKDKEVL